MANPRGKDKTDGLRRRCVGCGHPRVEHHGPVGCTVPKCPCMEYQLPDADPSPAAK